MASLLLMSSLFIHDVAECRRRDNCCCRPLLGGWKLLWVTSSSSSSPALLFLLTFIMIWLVCCYECVVLVCDVMSLGCCRVLLLSSSSRSLPLHRPLTPHHCRLPHEKGLMQDCKCTFNSSRPRGLPYQRKSSPFNEMRTVFTEILRFQCTRFLRRKEINST